MISIDGIWKRLTTLGIFLVGWQTSELLISPAWMALCLVYLLYVIVQIVGDYEIESSRYKSKRDKEYDRDHDITVPEPAGKS